MEALLSADNALVLALIAQRLPEKRSQGKALSLGIGLAFVLRAAGLLVASFIIKFWYLRAAGALYLLYLCAAHFLQKTKGHGGTGTGVRTATFASVVVALTFTDAAFAIDSILVAVALVDELWVIYIGVALGIVALRFVSGVFLKLLDRYPSLDHAAYLLVGWAGVKLGLEAAESFAGTVLHQHWPVALPDAVFWAGMALFALGGTVYALRRPTPSAERTAE